LRSLQPGMHVHSGFLPSPGFRACPRCIPPSSQFGASTSWPWLSRRRSHAVWRSRPASSATATTNVGLDVASTTGGLLPAWSLWPPSPRREGSTAFTTAASYASRPGTCQKLFHEWVQKLTHTSANREDDAALAEVSTILNPSILLQSRVERQCLDMPQPRTITLLVMRGVLLRNPLQDLLRALVSHQSPLMELRHQLQRQALPVVD
jgi:hypothetical protein